ncbi:MAG TPA: YCF48-related protein [Bryobacteraceae bacterium]|nr:YCF48-related protein [Bryobacteraceae bacterium]HOL73438.1 YCF48-related protein [Bryobacteraceae bacterium]HOQ46519.1 YCF48-related protein [Bryobacteraceae bacterium]HPQ16154.1 YCF48-related protein [Bryobacteraceae bacterium]HPU72677.1 YCF48-related protein [Bryobacteraceae bacterium]
MPRKSIALFFLAILGAAQLYAASCSIEYAAARGKSVWLLCEQNELRISSDAGETWQTRRITTDSKLRALALLDSRRAIAAGDDGVVMTTNDGGETWTQVPVPVQQNFRSICFVGDLGWIAGWNGVILHSSDGGKTWVRQETGVLLGLESIFFTDDKNGWAVGWAGTILRTTDGGKTWQKPEAPSGLWSLSSVYFRDQQNGWIVGFNGQILRSRDGGQTWERQPSSVQLWLKSIVIDDTGVGWIAADTQLLVSRDGGETWNVLPVRDAVFLQQVLRVGDSLWAVGQFGVFRQARGESEIKELASLRLADSNDSRSAN